MKGKNCTRSIIPVIVLMFFIVLFLGCSNKEEPVTLDNQNDTTNVNKEKVSSPATNNDNEIAIEPPPFTEGIFPCTECHAYMEPNPVRRKLVDMHDSISAIFDHDSANRWCLDCHDLNNRDSLKLASGKRIGFDESYKLCGQCHGDKLRDWKVGVHGKRTGEWNGKKQYLLCVNCHNPHSPRFKPLKPMPPPVRQEDIHK